MASPVVAMPRAQVAAQVKMFQGESTRVEFTIRRRGKPMLLSGKGIVKQHDKTAGRCVILVEHSGAHFEAPSNDEDLQIISLHVEGGGVEDVFSVLEGRAALGTLELADYVAWLPQLRDDAASLQLRDRITRYLGLPNDCLTREVMSFGTATRDDFETSNLVHLLRQQLSSLAVTVRDNRVPASADMAMLDRSFGRLYIMKIKKDHPKDAEYLAGRLLRESTLLQAIRDMTHARNIVREKELLESAKKQ